MTRSFASSRYNHRAVIIALKAGSFQNGSQITGNPGSVIVPQYGSSKITVFVWGKNIILKFLGNTK